MLLAAARAPARLGSQHTLAGANRSCIPLELAPSALVSHAAWCGYPARSLPSRDSPDAYCPFGDQAVPTRWRPRLLAVSGPLGGRFYCGGSRLAGTGLPCLPQLLPQAHAGYPCL